MIYKQDGDQICCHDEQFKNLQESIAGFGESEKKALEDFCKKTLESLGWKWAYLCGHGDAEAITQGDWVIGDIEKSMILAPPDCIWGEPVEFDRYF